MQLIIIIFFFACLCFKAFVIRIGTWKQKSSTLLFGLETLCELPLVHTWRIRCFIIQNKGMPTDWLQHRAACVCGFFHQFCLWVCFNINLFISLYLIMNPFIFYLCVMIHEMDCHGKYKSVTTALERRVGLHQDPCQPYNSKFKVKICNTMLVCVSGQNEYFTPKGSDRWIHDVTPIQVSKQHIMWFKYRSETNEAHLCFLTYKSCRNSQNKSGSNPTVWSSGYLNTSIK